jgi:hypothetical protein
VTTVALDADPAADAASWEEVRARQQAARVSFLNEARHSLQLGLGAPISRGTELIPAVSDSTPLASA